MTHLKKYKLLPLINLTAFINTPSNATEELTTQLFTGKVLNSYVEWTKTDNKLIYSMPENQPLKLDPQHSFQTTLISNTGKVHVLTPLNDEQIQAELANLEFSHIQAWKAIKAGNIQPLFFITDLTSNYVKLAAQTRNEKMVNEIFEKLYSLSTRLENSYNLLFSATNTYSFNSYRYAYAKCLMMLGCLHFDGTSNLPKDNIKALQYVIKAAVNGSVKAINELCKFSMGLNYNNEQILQDNNLTADSLAQKTAKLIADSYRNNNFDISDTSLNEFYQLDINLGKAYYLKSTHWKTDPEIRLNAEEHFIRQSQRILLSYILIDSVSLAQFYIEFMKYFTPLLDLGQDYLHGSKTIKQDRNKAAKLNLIIFNNFTSFIKKLETAADLLPKDKNIPHQSVIRNLEIFSTLFMNQDQLVIDMDHFESYVPYLQFLIESSNMDKLSDYIIGLENPIIYGNTKHEYIEIIINMFSDEIIKKTITSITTKDNKNNKYNINETILPATENNLNNLFKFNIKFIKLIDLSPKNIKLYLNLLSKNLRISKKINDLFKIEKSSTFIKNLNNSHFSRMTESIEVLERNLTLIKENQSLTKKSKILHTLYIEFLNEFERYQLINFTHQQKKDLLKKKNGLLNQVSQKADTPKKTQDNPITTKTEIQDQNTTHHQADQLATNDKPTDLITKIEEESNKIADESLNAQTISSAQSSAWTQSPADETAEFYQISKKKRKPNLSVLEKKESKVEPIIKNEQITPSSKRDKKIQSDLAKNKPNQKSVRLQQRPNVPSPTPQEIKIYDSLVSTPQNAPLAHSSMPESPPLTSHFSQEEVIDNKNVNAENSDTQSPVSQKQEQLSQTTSDQTPKTSSLNPNSREFVPPTLPLESFDKTESNSADLAHAPENFNNQGIQLNDAKTLSIYFQTINQQLAINSYNNEIYRQEAYNTLEALKPYYRHDSEKYAWIFAMQDNFKPPIIR